MRRLAVDLLKPVAAVLLVAAVAFALLGTWPPLVAVESGSMEPAVSQGDLVVVTAPDRFAGGVVAGLATADEGSTAGDAVADSPDSVRAGDVVVYAPPDRDGPPILHRVAFPVEAGEDWTLRADPDRLDGDDCATIRHCPAPYDGYVTYGDANAEYDQNADIAPVVREEWIRSQARFRVPYLGWLRIGFDALVGATGVVGGVAVGAIAGGVLVAVGRLFGR